MAKVFVKQGEISSSVTWLYKIITNNPIEVIKVDQTASNDNPLKILPYLIDGEAQIWGDFTVISHLAEKTGNKNSLCGDTSEEKSQINSLLFWLAGSFSRSALRDYVFPKKDGANICKLDLDSDNALLIEHGFKSTSSHLDNLEKSYFNVDNKKSLTSKQSIADYYLALILLELEKNQFKLDNWKNTNAWFKGFKPEVEKLLNQMV